MLVFLFVCCPSKKNFNPGKCRLLAKEDIPKIAKLNIYTYIFCFIFPKVTS